MMISSNHQDLTGILDHSSNLPTSSQSSLSSLLMKNHPPLSLLNETLPYLKSSHSLADDLSILGIPAMEDHHSDYDTKMKLSSVFDDDCDNGLISFGQTDIKMLDPENQCIKVQLCQHCISSSSYYASYTIICCIYYLILNSKKYLWYSKNLKSLDYNLDTNVLKKKNRNIFINRKISLKLALL